MVAGKDGQNGQRETDGLRPKERQAVPVERQAVAAGSQQHQFRALEALRDSSAVVTPHRLTLRPLGDVQPGAAEEAPATHSEVQVQAQAQLGRQPLTFQAAEQQTEGRWSGIPRNFPGQDILPSTKTAPGTAGSPMRH